MAHLSPKKPECVTQGDAMQRDWIRVSEYVWGEQGCQLPAQSLQSLERARLGTFLCLCCGGIMALWSPRDGSTPCVRSQDSPKQ